MNDTTDSLERLSASPGSVTPKREMGMMAWLATEGGRKCPACGKYAKPDELGFTGGTMMLGGVLTHISSYGHLEGYGCNRSQSSSPRGKDSTAPILGSAMVLPYRKPTRHRRASKEMPLAGIWVAIYHADKTITLPMNAPQKKHRGKVVPGRKWEAVADVKGDHFAIGGTIIGFSTLGPNGGMNLIARWSNERPKSIVRWRQNSVML